MVDGNFPAFWTRLPLILKYIVSILFSQAQPILGTQSSRWSSYFSSIFPELIVALLELLFILIFSLLILGMIAVLPL